MSFLLCRLEFAVCILLSITTCLVADDAAYDSSRFEITDLAAGLIQPMELSVAPDGTVFFIDVRMAPHQHRRSAGGSESCFE